MPADDAYAALRRKKYTPSMLSVFLLLREMVSIALEMKLAEWRFSGDSTKKLFAELEEERQRRFSLEDELSILRSLLSRCLSRVHLFYSPLERARICRVIARCCYTQKEAARRFVLSVSTIADWQRRLRSDPEASVIGSLIVPEPPIVRYDDAERALVQDMAEEFAGTSGTRQLAAHLKRFGDEISRSTVVRILKEGRYRPAKAAKDPDTTVKEAAPGEEATQAETPGPAQGAAAEPRVVRAKRPMHVAMADLTDAPLYRGQAPRKALSRMPLLARLLPKEPRARNVASMLDEVLSRFGDLAHFVSDKGRYFTGRAFRKRLPRRGIKPRFGRVHRHGSIALVERFIKTLKGLLRLPDRKESQVPVLQRQLDLAIDYYTHFRPHSALGGATPAEVFFDLPRQHLKAVHPPRGSPGGPWRDTRAEIFFLDPERRSFPVLIKNAA